MPVRWTANSHSTNSSANTMSGAARRLSHAPRLAPRVARGRSSRRSSRLRRVLRAAEILRAVFGRHVDLDQLEVVRARDDVVRDAGRLRQARARLARVTSPSTPAKRNVIQPFRITTKWPVMSCQCQPVGCSNGLMARMCLAPMRPPDAAARPRSRYSLSARGPSRVKAPLRRDDMIELGVRVREVERTLDSASACRTCP